MYGWDLHYSPESITTLLICYAAAAKSLQSCPTLCDPIDGSPPVSPVNTKWLWCKKKIIIINIYKKYIKVYFFFIEYARAFDCVRFSCSIVCNALGLHGLRHARLLCPSPTPGTCSDSFPSSQWCRPSLPLSSPSPPAFNLSQNQVLF